MFTFVYMIHRLSPTIDVHCPAGYAKAIAWIDYGIEVNTMWKVRLYENGRVINVYDDDILIYPNPANGEKELIIPSNWKQ